MIHRGVHPAACLGRLQRVDQPTLICIAAKTGQFHTIVARAIAKKTRQRSCIILQGRRQKGGSRIRRWDVVLGGRTPNTAILDSPMTSTVEFQTMAGGEGE